MARDQAAHSSGIRAFHIAVIGLSLLLTLTAWHFATRQVELQTKQRFDGASSRLLALIEERMNKYEDALWSGVAAVESHGGDMSHEEWEQFSRNLRIGERYPGISGIGVIHYHTGETLPAYLAEQRKVRPDFRVFPEHAYSEYMPITYVEPREANEAAIGLDVAYETNRRTAALLSRDSGQAQITGPIVLVQDSAKTPGFLFYAPFYRDGPPGFLRGRRSRFIGAVYAPFVVNRLVDGLLSQNVRGVRFSIRDGDKVIFDEHEAQDENTDPNPMFSQEVPLELYGRTWLIDIRTNMAFRAENTQSKPTIILAAGLVIECLIILLLYQMSQANARAISYADRVTERLKEESQALEATNQELSHKNEELEQYAYVTSHDLKTPIRGIGGLTEMIQEDLKDYFQSPDANFEVAENLEHILERVRRMDQLTRGILEFSQISPQLDANNHVELTEIVKALRLDFELSPGNLRLDTDVDRISVDTINFRRVIENLVGNAIKYHHAPEEMQIVVTVREEGPNCRVSVADNGPGIDERYHERIFEVFQTLRAADAPESTGIGLAIVKKAIKRHGSGITLTSEPGKGATFTFEWPISSTKNTASEMAA
ncbi:Periplasmic sensor signal transduction histidine kinase [Sulfitobacter noctilucae]|nr:Periplasmic sensor signal transduction histidine kinase [Sulfitobacter noctilucae]